MKSVDIIQAFKASLNGIDWMDKQSAKAAAEKVVPSLCLACMLSQLPYH